MNSGHLAKLPIELILHVCQYLPLRSIVCLALTNNPLYHSQDLQRLWRPRLDQSQEVFCCPQDFVSRDFVSEWGERGLLSSRKDILNHELLLVFELLERDLPNHWRCDICMKLHRRVEYTVGGRAYRPCVASHTQGVFYQLPNWNYTIPYEDAQQIIKRHAMGAPHGIPLTTIRKDRAWEVVCDWPMGPFLTPEQPPLVWYRQLDVSPEVVDAEKGPVLHLWTEQRLFFPSEYMEVLKTTSHDWVRDIGQRAQAHLAVCCHQHHIGEQVAELLESQIGLCRASSESRQCDICLTAYSFFIREGHCEGSLQVILSTWTSLGSCRYSFSPAWLTSSWLSRNHPWIRDSTIPRHPRPFHNDYSDFYTGRDLTRAAAFRRCDISRPSDVLCRLQPSQCEEPGNEFLRINSVTSVINSDRGRDKEVTDAPQRITAQVESQTKPSRRRFMLRNWFKHIWRHIKNRNARKE